MGCGRKAMYDAMEEQFRQEKENQKKLAPAVTSQQACVTSKGADGSFQIVFNLAGAVRCEEVKIAAAPDNKGSVVTLVCRAA